MAVTEAATHTASVGSNFMAQKDRRKNLVHTVAKVPELCEESSKSTACVLKDAGFPQSRHDIAVEEVAVVLKENPSLVDLWLERGADQILSGGWGIEQEDRSYRVKNYGSGTSRLIDDKIQACAEFVVHYVGFIGDALAKWH